MYQWLVGRLAGPLRVKPKNLKKRFSILCWKMTFQKIIFSFQFEIAYLRLAEENDERTDEW